MNTTGFCFILWIWTSVILAFLVSVLFSKRFRVQCSVWFLYVLALRTYVTISCYYICYIDWFLLPFLQDFILNANIYKHCLQYFITSLNCFHNCLNHPYFVVVRHVFRAASRILHPVSCGVFGLRGSSCRLAEDCVLQTEEELIQMESFFNVLDDFYHLSITENQRME